MISRKVKVAHFITDDKFPDSANYLFESVLPGANDFYLVGGSKKLKYIKAIKPVRCSFFSLLNPFFIVRIKKYDFVVLHSLTRFSQIIANKLSGHVPIVWVGMGYDYYDLIYTDSDDMLGPVTRNLMSTALLDKKKVSFLLKLCSVVKKSFSLALFGRVDRLKVISGIDFFAPVLSCEYEYISSKNPGVLREYVAWNYGVSIPVVEGEIKFKVGGVGNILLGNSGSVTNNHFDVLELLKDCNEIESRLIVCPLSYGGSEVISLVCERGREYFGEGFYPVLDFMSYESYVELISKCSHVIMNHKRQQAGGSVVIAVYMGCRVFINENSFLYKSYKENGVFINSMSELRQNPVLLNIPLTENEIEFNRGVLKQMFGRDAQLEKTRNLIDKVLQSRR